MCCFFRAFVFFAFHKRRDGIGFLARLFGALRLDTPVGSNTEATENPGFLARLFGAFGLGDGVSTSAEAREARRKRIEERQEKGDGDGKPKKKGEEGAAEESRSKAQISETRSRIDRLKTTGNAEVTKVRIMGDSRENERRINEEVNRQGRRQKLL